ncbi:MAG: hypothetical protein A2452_11945 [Candidatus Firestonebacteria bacterium RIFOXYC2_FULL_39_67]|nr:MAG: hypothetical protein A2536_07365 [Candidatus Firestonebacteria bacterium RIFOXYD2_FULL_39_29]OGF53930.1 MAG: hypothetical protein A2452_11945 [Candidatus Firestonebacteria bacterium RIFOXYC2_FULL_39_67]OGF54452.1 MAG: hypothetical protein A2497_07520 [Candidatus Firestonebacteria bacterium RifOxyC12_full_39_7]
MHLNVPVIDVLLFISILLLVLSISWLFLKLKNESSSLLGQVQNLFDQFKIINRSSELITSSNAPKDILNVITIEAGKIIKNVAVGIFLFEKDDDISVITGNEDFIKWVKEVTLNTIKLQKFWEDTKAGKQVEIKSPANVILVKTGVIIPVLIKGKVTGALLFLSLEDPRLFLEAEKKYMKIFASQISIVIENKKLIDQEKAYKEELLGINAITEIGLLSLTTEEVLEVLINRFVSISKSESAVIFMKSARTNECAVKAVCGFKIKRESNLLKENQEVVDNVFTSGKFVRITGRIGFPLKTNNEVFGCIVVYKDNITERELSHYSNLIEKASIIVERAKMNENTATIINELSAISYIGNVILSTLKLDDVLNLISKSVCEMMDAKGSTLRLLNEKTQELELCISYGLSSKCMDGQHLKVFTTSEGEVVETHQIMVIEDLENSKYEMSTPLIAEGIKSLVCIPLLAKNKVIGILTLFFRHKREFSGNDRKLMLIFTSHTAIAIENTRLFKNWKEMYLNVIKSFATALDEKDNYTKGHSEEVLRYATDIALEMGLKENEMELLQYSAILHDIGKIAISDNILKKPEKLTKEEYEVIKKHPVIGSNILANIEEFKDVAKIIAHHHEMYGGGGYPDGLKKEDIPILSRIITVVDSFEAMTSDRPYRKAMSHEKAIRELEGNKYTQFDPSIVDVFVKIMTKRKNDKSN